MYQIKIENTQETYFCSGDRDLLRGMEQMGRKGIPVGCRGGGCGICKVQILCGSWHCEKMSASEITQDERQQGIVLACRCYPRSTIVLKVTGKMKNRLEKFGTVHAG